MPHNTPLFNRPDTLLGVCEGLGTDLGIHPNILRIAFGVGLMWNPLAVIGTYLALGLAVYATRFLFPDLTAAAAEVVTVDPQNAAERGTTTLLSGRAPPTA